MSVLQTQNTALQTELAQCRQELAAAKAANRTLEASLSGTLNDAIGDRVEAQHLPLATALRQSEQRFQRLAVNIPGIIFQFRVDTNGIRTFPYISPQFETLFGISAAAVQQDAEVLVNCCHADDRASLEASTAESFTTLNPGSGKGASLHHLGKWSGFKVPLSRRYSPMAICYGMAF